jgi:hypothetical protein
MTLGNMRANGVRALAVSCWECHHQAVPPMPDGWRWPDDGRWASQLRQDAQHADFQRSGPLPQPGGASGASTGLPPAP